MFGATVGSLRMFLQTWQKSGNQGDEWQLVQSHVTLQKVHQVILEATVGGEAGDIAIDLCDFEEGSCNWQQQTTDDFHWLRHSGSTQNPNTGPDSDHTTNTPTGHYYYKGACVQLWYHMYGEGMGTLNVYQQSEDGKEALIFSQTGDQGRLWRFAQASLLPRVQPYRFQIVVEGVKVGLTKEGDMAFDDVQLTDAQCPPHGFCDFENTMCSWSNLGGEVDQGDWLRGAGASPNPNTGPSVDHTTNSSRHYVYVDSSVGDWKDMSYLISDVFQPSTSGHCLTFWYHMYGDHIGTLKLYINDWTEAGNKGDKWQEASVHVKHEEAFWVI
uniref:Si:ch211-106h4.4 n=1 Tax=Acanthochromis polyacanthus TaxID=80966 RepID=A0A3Q1GLC6_9TELE